jgi:DNA-binding transcriptional LysR family regulator
MPASNSCLNFRHASGETYRWEFDKGRQSLAVAVDGPLVVDDVQLLIRGALDGIGLAFLIEAQATPFLARGELKRVLEDWCQPFAGYFLYHPGRRHQPPALTALIDTLRFADLTSQHFQARGAAVRARSDRRDRRET